MIRAERPDAFCRLMHAATALRAGLLIRPIMNGADGAMLSSEPASALCGSCATTA